jgi:putative transport protein
VAVGLFSGGTTNTPSLAAAQQALKEVHGAGAPEIGMPALGYAVAYPFGIVGIILTMLLIRSVFRINPATDAAAFEKEQRAGEAHLENINLEVRNENLAGLPISKLLAMSEPGVVISRRSRGDKVEVAQPDMPLALGDVIHAVGPKPALESLRVVVGKLSDVDVRTLPSEIATERILVSKKSHLGRSIGELDFENLYGVIITRVARGDVEFAASTAVRVQFGDLLTVVGQPDSIARVARELGNSPKQLNHPHLIPVFLGIALGVLLGSMPLSIPGIPAALKLGMAGGPLLAALILSQVGRIGPLIWYMPPSANFMLREVGIVLFLSCVGLKSGTQFFGLLANGQGLLWMGLAAFITLIPILLVGLFARVVRKENFVNICGLLAGSMTDPPALAFANQITKSDTPSISYATVYPLVMLLRVFVAQALVLLIR